MKFFTNTDWKKISESLKGCWVQSSKKRDKKAFFCNSAMAFDTETSSFKVLEKDEKGKDIALKRGCMYLWHSLWCNRSQSLLCDFCLGYL